MKRFILTSTLAALVLLTAIPVRAAGYLGWADEFVTGHVYCNTSAPGCRVNSVWAGPGWLGPGTSDPSMVPTWSTVGMQGTDPAGRANARSKVFFQLADTSTTLANATTVTVSRFRTFSPPIEGSTCGGAFFVMSFSHTFAGSDAPADTRWEARLLPTANFSSETAVNATVGYREDVTGTSSAGSATKSGCFKIRWL